MAPSPRDLAQRGHSLALRRLSELKATHVAEAMGTSDAAISKLKNEHLEQSIALLAHLGLKVVDASAKCMPRDAFEFLTATHQRVMARVPHVIWEDADE